MGEKSPARIEIYKYKWGMHMKFLHTADLHIGKSIYEFNMLEDQRYILQEILQIADEEISTTGLCQVQRQCSCWSGF